MLETHACTRQACTKPCTHTPQQHHSLIHYFRLNTSFPLAILEIQKVHLLTMICSCSLTMRWAVGGAVTHSFLLPVGGTLWGHPTATPAEGQPLCHESRGILCWVLSRRLSVRAARTCPWFHLPVVPPVSHPACIVMLQKTTRSPRAMHSFVDQWGTQDFSEEE